MSAWVLWDNLANAPIQSFAFWNEWSRAMTSVSAAATGKCYWPRMMTPWAEGTITGATETTITDSAATTWVIAGGCTGTSRWVGYECSGQEHVPMDYDVLVEVDPTDPRKVFRVPITANTSTVLTVNSMAINKDVYKQFSSYSDLVGKTYRIVRRASSDSYPTWNERRVLPRNALVDQGTATSAAAGSITDSSKAWEINEFAGREIIYNASGLKRATVSSNTATTITFGGSDVASGTYEVIVSGTVWLPDGGDNPFRWYSGVEESAFSIYPDGSVAGSYHAAATIELLQGQTTCNTDVVDALGVDVWTGFDDQCTPEKSFSPDFYKSIIYSSLAFMEGICIHFIDRETSGGATAIPNLTAATLYHLAGVNSFSTNDVSDGGDVEFTINIPDEYTSIEILYAVYDPDGNMLEAGTAITSGTLATTVGTPTYDGETIDLIYSYGATRTIERQVRRVYARTYFQPDDDSGPVDPPSETFPGTWVTIPADTNYTEWDEYGYPGEGGTAFIDNDYVRYTANAFHDGIIAEGTYTASLPDDIDYIKWAEEQYPGTGDGDSGTATGGTNRQLTDTSKSWYVSGLMRTEGGTATGGSTTTLQDSSKSGSSFWNGTGGRWIGFILVVDGEKRPITGHSGTTLTVTEPFSASTSGKAYSIQEPDNVLNRWQGRTVEIIHDGDTYTATISHSDNDTIYFSSTLAFTVTAGDTYSIIEHKPGTVIRRASGAWAAINNPTAKHPTTATRYGKPRNRDFVTPTLLEEMKAMRNQLKKRKSGISLHAREDDGTPENNTRFVSTAGSGPVYLDDDATQCDESKTLPDDYWDDPLEYTESESSAYPEAYSIIRMYSGLVSGSSLMSLYRHYAYFSTIDPNSCLPRTVQMWGYCDAYCAAPATYSIQEFNDQGDGVAGLGCEQWFPIGSETTIAAGDTESERVRIGQDQSIKPDWGSCPPMIYTGSGQGTTQTIAGWRMSSGIAILDYDMEFIDE